MNIGAKAFLCPEGGAMSDKRQDARGRKTESVEIIPHARRLWVYTTDPAATLSTRSFNFSTAVLEVPWEPALSEGPIGEYVAVVDHDPASGKVYAPVNLREANLLAQDGVLPSIENPKFHQQMVYAVAMRVINRFEHALGRRVLWADKPGSDNKPAYVQRLMIYPHALRARNAYYSPEKVALLFGYFRGLRKLPRDQWQLGGMVFTCLSFDVVAHETTHAILDGVNPRLRQATNPDVLAFHEAFADIVALFERFTLADLLTNEITRARGRLSASQLGELAKEFGLAMGYGHALRDAINSPCEERNYLTEQEPHARGAVLVAAVFDAFKTIYEARIGALTAIIPLPVGDSPIHPTLVSLLVREARKAAEHVLTMCIRAIDYLPPVDIRFSDFLRALITADADVVTEDQHGYRVAFIEAFARRYIFAEGVRSVSVETLRWKRTMESVANLEKELAQLRSFVSGSTDRSEIWNRFVSVRKAIRQWVRVQDEGVLKTLGLDPSARRKIKVESARLALRMTPDGHQRRDIVVVFTQEHKLDSAERKILANAGWPPQGGNTGIPTFLSGSTVIVSLDQEKGNKIRYVIWKNPASSGSSDRRDRTMGYLENEAQKRNLGDSYGITQTQGREPFAMLHGRC
jgi:hypothetical protein